MNEWILCNPEEGTRLPPKSELQQFAHNPRTSTGKGRIPASHQTREKGKEADAVSPEVFRALGKPPLGNANTLPQVKLPGIWGHRRLGKTLPGEPEGAERGVRVRAASPQEGTDDPGNPEERTTSRGVTAHTRREKPQTHKHRMHPGTPSRSVEQSALAGGLDLRSGGR